MNRNQNPKSPKTARSKRAWLAAMLSAGLFFSGVINNWSPSAVPNLAMAQSDRVVTSAVNLVSDARAKGESFPVHELFEEQVQSTAVSPLVQQGIQDGTILKLKEDAAEVLFKSRLSTLTLLLPSAAGKPIELELVRVDVLTSDFAVLTSDSQGLPVLIEPGIHYRGIVKGSPNSLAAVSIFRDEVTALFSTEQEGNFVLGKMSSKEGDGDHILYAEKDVKERAPFICDSEDNGQQYTLDELQEQPAAVIAKCVRVYVEADLDLFVNLGSSVGNVVNFVSAFFNQVATIYANEGIPIALSSVFVWTTPSPYTGNDSATLLGQFRSFRNSFNGDFGHLINLKPVGGRAAVGGLCSSNTDNRQAISGVSTFFSNVPAYSWTVDVFSHEMGHQMGSQHTHACVWNGNNTAIDGCGPTFDPQTREGSCPIGPIPAEGGTIMSYCHLVSVGKNFTKGFGPQPGNLSRARYVLASSSFFGCLTSCTINQPRLQINLTNNTFLDTTGGAISFVNSPSGGRTVVRITLNPGTTGFSRARFTVIYTGNPTAWTVNIGDSSTNNGGGGDSGTQSNDAEIQVLDTTLTVLGRDATPPPKNLIDVFNFVAGSQTVNFEVSNNFFSWSSPATSDGLPSIYLYALNGQVDAEGGINYDIYAAFNRVISDPSALRVGSGVGFVTIDLLP